LDGLQDKFKEASHAINEIQGFKKSHEDIKPFAAKTAKS